MNTRHIKTYDAKFAIKAIIEVGEIAQTIPVKKNETLPTDM